MSMVFALVLLGCADDGTACERLTPQPEHYATKALCEASQESALTSEIALKADHPTVISRCLPRSGVVAQGRGKLSTRSR